MGQARKQVDLPYRIWNERNSEPLAAVYLMDTLVSVFMQSYVIWLVRNPLDPRCPHWGQTGDIFLFWLLGINHKNYLWWKPYHRPNSRLSSLHITLILKANIWNSYHPAFMFEKKQLHNLFSITQWILDLSDLKAHVISSRKHPTDSITFLRVWPCHSYDIYRAF